MTLFAPKMELRWNETLIPLSPNAEKAKPNQTVDFSATFALAMLYEFLKSEQKRSNQSEMLREFPRFQEMLNSEMQRAEFVSGVLCINEENYKKRVSVLLKTINDTVEGEAYANIHQVYQDSEIDFVVFYQTLRNGRWAEIEKAMQCCCLPFANDTFPNERWQQKFTQGYFCLVRYGLQRLEDNESRCLDRICTRLFDEIQTGIGVKAIRTLALEAYALICKYATPAVPPQFPPQWADFHQNLTGG